MIGRKSMFTQHKRLLRPYDSKRGNEPDKAGLTINDYDILCKPHSLECDRNMVFARRSRSLILK